jgi:energy-coupling factor transporter ATP-binding protein EcfA2
MSALSRGTAQKVAISQALMADADLLVLDEAWTGLDAESRSILDEAVEQRLATGTTVVFVDHQHTAHTGRTAEVRVVRDGAVVPGPRPAAAGSSQGIAAGTAGAMVVEIEFEDGVTRRTVRVPAEASDDTLRQVLAQPHGHVRSVRTLPG